MDYFTVGFVLNLVIGVLWVYIGGIMTLMLDRRQWPRLARMAVFVLGLMAGIYRIDHALWSYGNPERSFLQTYTATVDNIFLSLGMLIFCYYLTRIYRAKGGADD